MRKRIFILGALIHLNETIEEEFYSLIATAPFEVVHQRPSRVTDDIDTVFNSYKSKEVVNNRGSCWDSFKMDTFQDVIDVVFVVVDPHGVIEVSVLVAVTVLRNNNVRIIVFILDEIKNLSQTPWRDSQP